MPPAGEGAQGNLVVCGLGGSAGARGGSFRGSALWWCTPQGVEVPGLAPQQGWEGRGGEDGAGDISTPLPGSASLSLTLWGLGSHVLMPMTQMLTGPFSGPQILGLCQISQPWGKKGKMGQRHFRRDCLVPPKL